MVTALKYLVMLGIVIWVLLLVEQYKPFGAIGGYFDDPNESDRCKQYETYIEEDRVLDYRDRVAQFISGCW